MHGRALCFGILAEIGAGHSCAVDPVAPGLGADIDDRVADPGGGGVENLVLLSDADSHRVDQNVAIICAVEIGFPADGRHPDAVAIAADARNHAFDQRFHLRVIRPPKPQRIHVCHRPRAHGEDIAQNAANARRRALIGFDVAGVVVRFHFEDRGLAIADVDHAGVFARTADHPGGFGGKLLEVEAARFIAAMLRPHHREYAELDHIRLTPQRVQHAGIFFFRQPVGCDDICGDLGHGRALAG